MTPVLALALLLAFPARDAKGLPYTRSESVLVRFADTGEVLYSKKPDEVRPIASVTKLVSALVLERDARRPADTVTIGEEDKDRLKWSKSRLKVGLTFTGDELYKAALVASDNRAMYAVVRSAGYVRDDFVEEMNALAGELGMSASSFRDPAGIDPGNVSTAADLMKLLAAVGASKSIPEATRTATMELETNNRRVLKLTNTNRLLRSKTWSIEFAKTGYTVEAGRNFVVRANVLGRPVDMVFLGAREMASVFGDAKRVEKWIVDRTKLASK